MLTVYLCQILPKIELIIKIRILKVKFMVKGVNKTVIVVNDTGSRYFDKIVFYVSDEYGNYTAKQLNKAVKDYEFKYFTSNKNSGLRKKYLRRRRNALILLLGGAISIIATVLMILL